MSDARSQETAEAARPLSLPSASREIYKNNLIRQVVCEVRYPTLLELDTESPVEIQRAIRKEYPRYEKSHHVTVSPNSEPTQSIVHMFVSKDGRWRFSVRSSAFTLETQAYQAFEEFHAQFSILISRVVPLLDTDFFTRIGLRYINELPVTDHTAAEGWVNPALLAPLATGVFGTPTRCFQELRGRTASEFYSFRHGFAGSPDALGKGTGYILDSDVYDELTDAKNASRKISEFHQTSYNLFAWSVGPKAMSHMKNTSKEAQQ